MYRKKRFCKITDNKKEEHFKNTLGGKSESTTLDFSINNEEEKIESYI